MFERMLVGKIENRITVGLISLVLTMVFLGWAAINEGGRMQAFQQMEGARAIEQGAILFAANCTSCHGLDGRGLAGKAPGLNNPMLFGHDFFPDVTKQISDLNFSVGQPPQPTNSSNPSSDAATGSSPSAQTSDSEQLTANRPLSPGGTVQQKASEMARILDQLDRDIYAQQNPSETGDSKQNGETDVSRSDPNSGSNKIRNGKGNMSSARQSAIESSAQQLASEMNQSRMEQLNRNPGGQTYLRNQKGAQSGGKGTRGPNPMEKAEDYSLPNSQSTSDRDWGKLRTQRAVDVKEGTRESFDPEFDQAIRAYYQAIGDAAAGK